MERISTLAAEDQQRRGYSVDMWLDHTLAPGFVLWQGVGGESKFFFSDRDARVATGAEGSKPTAFAESFWRLAQVEPSKERGYRREIAQFVVCRPVAVAMGVCMANRRFGHGTVVQYFILDWRGALLPTGVTHRFQRVDWPSW